MSSGGHWNPRQGGNPMILKSAALQASQNLPSSSIFNRNDLLSNGVAKEEFKKNNSKCTGKIGWLLGKLWILEKITGIYIYIVLGRWIRFDSPVSLFFGLVWKTSPCIYIYIYYIYVSICHVDENNIKKKTCLCLMEKNSTHFNTKKRGLSLSHPCLHLISLRYCAWQLGYQNQASVS